MRLRTIRWKPHASTHARLVARAALWDLGAIAGRASTVKVWVIDWSDVERGRA